MTSKAKQEPTIVSVKKEPKKEPKVENRQHKQQSLPVRKTNSFKGAHASNGPHRHRYGKKKKGEKKKKKIKDKSVPKLPLSENACQLPPWLLTRPSCNHNPFFEAIDYARFCGLTPTERSCRDNVISTVQDMARSKWPQARTHLFGSYATGLSISGSDIDVIVTGAGLNGMAKLIRAERKFARDVVAIKKAKVPILKFKAIPAENSSPVQCDVSFGNQSALDAVPHVRQTLIDYPDARPIFLVAKTLLSQHHLNEVCFGGLGSFTLFNMVISHLQKWESNYSSTIPAMDKSRRLLETFFSFYGTRFEVEKLGISTRNGGSYYDRATRFSSLTKKGHPKLIQGISVEDPVLTTNELGTNCYKLKVIRKLFADAAKALQEWSVDQKGTATTPLSAVLKITNNMRERRKSVIEHLQSTMKDDILFNLFDAIEYVEGVEAAPSGPANTNLDTSGLVWCQRTAAKSSEKMKAKDSDVIVVDDDSSVTDDEVDVQSEIITIAD